MVNFVTKNSTVSGLKSFEGNVLFRKEEKGLTPSTWLLHHLFRYMEEKKYYLLLLWKLNNLVFGGRCFELCSILMDFK